MIRFFTRGCRTLKILFCLSFAVLSFNSFAQSPTLDLDLSGPGNDYSTLFQKGGNPVPIADMDVAITDADDTNMEGVTITLTNRPNGSSETLSVSGTLPAGISVSNAYDNADGVIELSGTALIADYETAIEQIVYENVSINPNNDDRSITVVVSDGTNNSSVATTTLSIKFPPTLSAIGPAETTTEDTQVEIDFLEIINNSDAADVDGTVTAFVVQAVQTGTLSIGTTKASATPFAVSTNDVVSADLGLKAFWTPASNSSGTLSAFSVVARDDEGFLSSDPITVPIGVNEINDLPIANDDSGSTNEDTPVTLPDITDNDTDEDGTVNPATIVLIDPNDFLNTGDQYNPLVIAGEGIFEVDVNGDLTFTPETLFIGTAQASYTVKDNSLDTSNEANVTITVSANTPPELDLDADNGSGATGNSYATAFLDGSVGVIIVDTDVKVTDVDDTHLEKVTIKLVNRPDGINEQLSIDGTLPPGITVTDPYSDSDGILVLSGTAELDDYENALKVIRYTNVADESAGELDDTPRVIEITINDGTDDSDVAATTTVSVGCDNYPKFIFVEDTGSVNTPETGTHNTVGAIYRFDDVQTGIDALVEIVAKNNCDLVALDDTSLGYNNSFQPLIDPVDGSQSEVYIDFKLTFVDADTSTPHNFSNLAVISQDIDGNGQQRDFIGFVDSPGVTLENNNNIIRRDDGRFTTFESSVTTGVVSTDPTETDHMVFGTFANTASFEIRAGVKNVNSGGINRVILFDMFQTCFYNNFGTPRATPNSASKTITINEDETYNFADVDFSFTDQDGHGFDALVIKSLPTNGTLRYNSNAVTQTNVNNGTQYGTRTNFSFEPVANENGNPYSNFIFQVKDDSNHPETEFAALVDTITFKVVPVNDPPVAVNDNYSVSEGGTLTADDFDGNGTGTGADDGVLVFGTDDSDVDGDNLTVSLVTGPSYNGAAFVLNEDGTFVYVHDGSENLTDSFVYEISDGNGLSDQATATITVSGVNDPPVLDLDGNNSSGAVGQDYFTSFIEDGDPVAIADSDDDILDDDDTNIQSVTLVLTNRPDGANESLGLPPLYSLPLGIFETDTYNNNDGTMVVSGTGTKAEYEEIIRNILYDNTASGPDVADRNVTVIVNDGDSNSNTAIANITVSTGADFDRDGVDDIDDLDDDNDGIPDTAEYCDQGGFGCLPGGVDPSGDEDGDTIPNYKDASDFSVGNGCLDLDFNGICDSIVADYDTDGDGIPNHLDLNSDGDSCADAYEAGHGLTVLTGGIIAGPYGANGLANSVETSAESGSINYTSAETQAGTFDAQNGSYDSCVPQLDLDQDDSSGAILADYLTSFTEGNINLRMADTDVEILDNNDVKIESATIILINRPDGTQESLSVKGTLPPGISISDPYNNNDGTLVLVGSAALSSYQAAIEQIVYNNSSSNPDNTQREITVVINDGDNNSNIATSRINVSPVNASPIAINDTNSITEGTASVNESDGSGQLDANDIDTDGDVLTILDIDGETNDANDVTGSYGTLNWSSNGTYTYNLNNSLVDDLAAGETVQETFTYTVFDGTETDQATLRITITGSNDNPVASDDINQINNSTDDTVNQDDGSGGLLTNDTDLDGDGLNVASMQRLNTPAGAVEDDPGNDVVGQYGTINWETNGTYIYDLDEGNGAVSGLGLGQTLTETFQYVVSDANGTDSGLLTITITGGSAEVTITSTASAGDDTGSEPGADDGLFTVLLSVTNNSGGPLNIDYSVSGTATSGSDYTALTGSVNIPNSSNQATIPLDVLNDGLAECSDETVIVTLLGTSDVEIGAQSSATVTIIDDDNITPTVSVADVCSGEDAVVSITGASNLPNGTYDFEYSVTGVGSFTASDVSIAGGAGSFSVSGLAAGNREIDVTGIASPCNITSVSAAAQFTVNSGSSAAVISGTTSICKGESASISVDITGDVGPYTVRLSDGSVITNYTSGTPISVSPTSNKTYTITSVRSVNGCLGSNNSGSATITVNQGSTAATVSGATSICQGTSTNLTVEITGGNSPYTVVLNGIADPITSYTSGALITVSPTVTTSYTIASITDLNGCLGTGNAGTATVTVTNDHTIDSHPSDVDVCVGGGAMLSVTASGASGNLTYQWQSSTDNVSFGNISGANASTYSAPTASAGIIYYKVLVGDDALSCDPLESNVATVTVEAFPNTTALGLSLADICLGTNATAVFSGNLANGTYTVTYDLSAPNSGTGLTATATISGGAGAGSFTVPSSELTNTGNTTLTITSIANTFGQLCAVTGMSLADNFAVNTIPTVSFNAQSNPSNCGQADGSITLDFTNVPDGTYNIDYAAGTFNAVSVSGGSATITGLGEGAYNDINITVAGCTSVQDVDVTLTDRATLTIDDVSVSENAGTATFTVTLSCDVAGGVDVDYSATGVSATEGSDFSLTDGTLTFTGNQGETETIVVTISSDMLLEDDETYHVDLSNIVTGGQVTFADNQGLGTITDDDTALASISANDPTAAEPSDNGQFTVSLSNQSATATVISYSVGGSATATDDYTALSGSVTVPANTSSATIDVSVVDNNILEADETVVVTLTSISSGDANISIDGSNNAATVTISDEDTALASISANDPTAAEPSDNGQFTVSLSNQSATATVISYSVGGSATATDDYTALSGSVTVPANTSSATIDVSVVDNNILEADETVVVTLTGISSGDANISIDGSNNAATVTISDEDTALASISANDPTAAEPSDNGQFTVSLSNQSATATVISYSVGGSATATDDYTALSGSVTVPANTSSATIDVSVVDNNILEADETVVVTLTSISSGDANISIDGSNNAATVTISDEDTALASISANDPTAAEPSDNGQFTVSLSNQSATATVISYSVGGSATATDDYTALSGSVTVPANTSSATIDVSVVDNNILEADETVVVTLTGISSGDANISIDGSNNAATVTISDEDTALASISANDPTAAEPSDNGQFTVSLSNQSATATVISYSVGGSATATDDYTALSGSVTVPANTSSATIDVSVVDNNILEADETVVVTLTGISSGDANISIDGSNNAATVTISDEDTALASISANDPTAAEPSDNGQFTVSLSNQSATATVISYSVSGSATATDDYTALSGSVTVPANTSSATIDVSVVDNNILEADETVVVTLTSISSGDANISIDGSNNAATVTISDEDTALASISANDPTAAEPSDNGQFTVSLSNQSATATVISYSVGGSATATDDYTALSGSVTVPANTSSATIDVSVVDNNILEADETVVVTLTSISSGDANISIDGSNNAATVTISDEDTSAVTINDASETEGGNITFDLALVDSVEGDVVVDVEFSDVSATGSGTDYTSTTQRFTFNGGVAGTKSVVVPTSADNLIEGNETFTASITLVSGNPSVDVSDTGTGTIDDADDDTATQVNITKVQDGAESGDDVIYTVSLSDGSNTLTNVSGAPVTVDISFVTGSSAEQLDFTTVFPTTVSVANGTSSQTVTLQVDDDALLEGTEVLRATISTSGPESIGTATANANVIDNDVSSVTINDAIGVEGNNLTFTLELTQDTAGDVVVDVEFSDVSATGSGTDYTSTTQRFTFSGGTAGTKSVLVPASADNLIEGDETFTASITLISGNPSIDVSDTGDGTIDDADDDAATQVNIAAVQNGTEAGDDVVYSVTLSDGTNALTNVSGSAITVDIGFAAGSEAVQADLSTTFPTSVSIADGTASATVTLEVAPDDLIEGEEILKATISNPSIGTVNTDNADATIDDADDDGATQVNIATVQNGTEAGDDVVYSVTLSDGTNALTNVSGSAITVDIGFAAGSEAVQADLSTTFPTSVSIADGTASATVTLAVAPDNLIEGEEILKATISNPSIGTVNTDNADATIDDADDDGATQVNIATVQNGTEAGDDVVYSVTLSDGTNALTNVSGSAITVDIGFAAGSEAVQADLSTIFPTSVSIADGTASATVTLEVAPDDLIEGEEILKATISNPSIGTVNTDNADATIDDADDDGATQVNIATVQNGTEAGDDVVYSVTLSDGTNALTNVSGSAITVDIGFAAGSEAVQADLSTTFPTSVSIADGTASATVTLAVAPDNLIEGEEILKATISNPSIGTVNTDNADATIDDADDDAATQVNIATVQNGTEAGDDVVYSVTLSDGTNALTNVSGTPITVDIGFAAGSEAVQADLSTIFPTSVSIADGTASATVTLAVAPDNLIEGEEILKATISNPSIGTVNTDNADATIDDADDDAATQVNIAAVQNGTEAGDDVVYSVTLSDGTNALTNESGTPITMDIDFAAGSEAVQADLSTTFPTSVSIADGTASATVTLAVAPDNLIEGEEILKATISNPSIGTVNTDNADATIDDADDDAATQVNIAAVQNGTEAGDDVVYSVTLSDGTNALTNESGTPITVDIGFAAGSEAVQADLSTTFPTSVSIADGTASATVTLEVAPDDLIEGEEILKATISNPSIGTVNTDNADATIDDADDDAATQVNIATVQNGTEAGDDVVYSVTLSDGTNALTNVSGSAITVDIGFAAGSEAVQADLSTTFPTSVSIADGTASATVTLAVAPDNLIEGEEILKATISNPSIGTVNTDNADATIDDADDDAATQVNIATVQNGTEAGDDVVYSVTLSDGTNALTNVSGTPITVDIGFAAGSEAVQADLSTIFPTSVSIADGTASATVTLAVAPDNLIEGEEILKATISNPSIGTVNTDNADATIDDADDDAATQVNIATVQNGTEAGDDVVYSVTLSDGTNALTNVSGTPITVDIGFAAGSEAVQADLTTIFPTSVSIADGTASATVTLAVAPDNLIEGEEILKATISNPSIGTVNTDNADATIDDADDDAATQVNIAAVQNGTEAGDDVVYSVTLSDGTNALTNVSGTPITVDIGFAAGSEAVQADLTTIFPTSVSIADGTASATVTLAVAPDNLIEGEEILKATISNPSIGTVNTDNADATIDDADDDAATQVNIAAVQNGTEAGDDVVYSVTLSDGTNALTNVSGSAITVDIGFAAGSEAVQADLSTTFPTSVSIADGTASATVTLEVAPDDLIEGEEILKATISNPSIGTVNTDNADATIDDADDDAATQVNIATVQNGTEAGDDVVYSVTLSDGTNALTNVSGSAITVDIGFAAGSEAVQADLSTTFPTSVSIADGTASATVTLEVAPDDLIEGEEILKATISNPSIGTVNTDNADATIDDADDDGATQVNIATVQNGTEAGDDVVYSVTLSDGTNALTNVSGSAITVDIGFAAGSEAVQADLSTIFPTSVSIADGTASATVTLSVIDDTVLEGTELLRATINNPSLGTIGAGSADADIIDNDEAALTIDDASAQEGDPLVFTVTLDNAVAAPFTVDVSFSDVSATGSVDYDDAPQTISFTGVAGETQTFSVTSTEDADVEDDETFTVQMSASNPLVTDGDQATGTITNDDFKSDLAIEKSVDNDTPAVGDDVVFTITVTNNGPSIATGVSATDQLPSGYTYVSDDGGGDYNSASGVWTIGSMADDEIVSLNITVTVNATGIYTNTATVAGDQDDPGPGPNTDTETPIPGLIQGDIQVSDICEGDNAIAQLSNFDNLADGLYRVDYSLNSGSVVTINNLNIVSGSATFEITEPAANTYTIEVVKIFDASMEELNIDDISNSFEVKTVPSIVGVDPSSPTSCNGTGSIGLTLSGVSDGSYNFSFDGGTFENVVVSGGLATIDNLLVGDYNDITLTIAACTSIEDIDVVLTDPALPTMEFVSSEAPSICNASDGTIVLSVSNVADGSYTMVYDGGSFDNVPVQSGTATISSVSAGTYQNLSITVSGCTSIEDVAVVLEDGPVPGLTVASTTSPSCSGTDGSITFTFTNVEDGDYAVTFDGGSFGNLSVVSGEGTISNISQGTYNNITIDVATCSSTDGVNVVLNCNPPVADDENVTISEDTPVTVSAVTGDFDPDGSIVPSTIVLTDPNDPSNTGNSSTPLVIAGEGTYVVDTEGRVTFTPELNFNGVSRVNYTVEDNEGNLSNIATITVTVTPVNDGPEAIDDVESVNPGQVLTSSVGPNDVADPEGDHVSYSVVGGTLPNETSEGTLSFNPDGTYTFTPVSGFTGVVEFEYEVCDDGTPSVCSTATVSINVGTNEPPVADDETISTNEDSPVTLDITEGDIDSDGSIVASSIIMIDPNNSENTGNSSTPLVIAGEGTYSVDADGNLTFEPTLNFTGISTVGYTIKDNLGARSNVATVTITVDPINDGPGAVDDEETMDPGTTLVSSVGGNDIPDPEGDNLTYSVVGGTEPNPATEGNLTFNPDGSFEFTPIGGFEGLVTFSYEVCDDGVPSECSTATVTIDVTDNLPPVADNDSATTDEDKEVTILVVDGDTDADGTINPGTIILIDPNDAANTGNKTTPLEIAGEGTYEVDNLGNVTFIPAFNFNGTSQVNYTVKDNLGATSNVAEVVITVTPLNDAPIADNESASIGEDTPITIDVTDGDIDFDGNIVPSTIKLIDPNNPANAGDSTTPVTITGEGTYSVDASGNLTFTPEANFTGTASINYTIEDDEGAVSNVARVNISVTPVNDGPEAIDDVESVNPGEVLTSSVGPNDVPDPEGDNVSYSTIAGTEPDESTQGTLVFNPDGSYTFTPVAGFEGLVEFDYQVCDDGDPQACSSATVSIHVGVNTPPVADNDATSTDEDEPVSLDITDGDVDSDGSIEPSSILLIDPSNSGLTGTSSSPLFIPGEGTYSVDANGNLTFVPIANFNGTSTVQYTIKDNLGAKSNVATVTVTVNPVNDGPGAVNDEETMSPGTTLTSSVTGNDLADPEGDALSYSVVSGTEPNEATEGDLIFLSDGSYQFTPVNGFIGAITFQYEVCDNGAPVACSTAEVTINVSTNIPPVADNDDAIITEDNQVTIFIINGDDDEDGTLNPFEIVLIDPADPGHTGDNTRPLVIEGEGTYSLDPLGNVTFKPEPNFVGTSTINYTVEDNVGAKSNIATITITVTPVNDPPVAVDDEVTGLEDEPIAGSVLDNDTDPEGDDLTVNTTPVTPPSKGTLVINPDGTFTYTPDDMFNGTDSFVYEVCDNGSPSACDRATVVITVDPVNDPPVAMDDEVSGEEDTPISGSVLDNDTDPEGDDLTVSTTPVTPPSNGTLVINPDGTFTYTPDDMFNGTDSFVYEVCDDGSPSVCDQATVTITVGPVNDPPMAMDDEVTGEEDTPVSGNVLDNDTDPEGDELAVNTTPVTPPSNGTLVLNPDGTFTYTPDDMFNGTDSFVYEVCDNGTPSVCDQATVTITVGPVNDPPVAVNDEAETDFETPVSGNLISNDEDPDGDDLVINTTPVNPPSNGTLVINPDGTFTYTPDDGFVGSDEFTYEVCDNGTPVICSQATVSITVNSTNEAPEAADDVAATDSITPVEGNVLDNDTDPNGDNLTVNPVPVISPMNGTLVLNPDGSYIYTPDTQFEGEDTFEYEVCDDGVPSLCTTAEVVITVELPPLVVPQIFGGPNNPSWYIEGIEEYPDNEVKVFNRWGNLVFEIKGYDNSSRNWASESSVGIILGSNLVPDGTYFYVIDLGDGSKPKSGFVVVNR